jgi:hypothetical protein
MTPIVLNSNGIVSELDVIELLLLDLVAFGHSQLGQIGGRQPYLNVRKTLYVIAVVAGEGAHRRHPSLC